MMPIDWDKLKGEYIRGGISYDALSIKYNVPYGTIKNHAYAEKWGKLRTKAREKANQKITDKMADKKAARADNIASIADALVAKIKNGIDKGTYTVDANSVRQIVSAVKDLQQIKGIKSELDVAEQLARIGKLRKEATTEEQDKSVRVIISDELDKYSR